MLANPLAGSLFVGAQPADNIAEPGALIGFAGPRVIKETIKKDLPEGFQRSEFLLEHGFLDFIIDRKEMKEKLTKVLTLFKS